MDFLKKMGSNQTTEVSGAQQTGNTGGGFMDKVNNSMGGGKSGEAKEDYLDKGVDFVQERFMGAGPQNDESAMEQAKDEQISDAIRRGYKGSTGSDFPIKDKE